MSIWTHVAAIVRINDLRLNDDDVLDFEKIFGKQLRFDDYGEIWDYAYDHPDEFLPLGSEGSLTMSVWINPDKSFVAAYTVSIFGDLRDYDNPNKIVEWFKEKCLNDEFSCRDAAIVAHTDNGKPYFWYSDD